MNQKSILRLVLTCLVVFMLAANAVSVAASTELTQSSGKVFTVSPSGGDDTAKIQQAFDKAVKAGPGSTVKLAAGNYHTRFIEVWNFDGTFMGAGQNQTIIDTFAEQDCQTLIDKNRIPTLFNFFHGNVRVSDLGFNITPTAPCKPYLFGGFPNSPIANWIGILAITTSPFVPETDCLVVQKERVSGSITRVAFQGRQGLSPKGNTDTNYWNVGHPILLGGTYPTKDLSTTDCIYFLKYAQGSFSVTDTVIQKTQLGIDLEYTYNSPVRISGNTYNMGSNGIILENNSGSLIEISNNHSKSGLWSGIWVWHGGLCKQPYIDSPAVYDIHDNLIEGDENSGWWTGGVIVFDSDTMGNEYFSPISRTALVSIRNNRIQLAALNQPGVYDGLFGVWLEGVDGSLVSNNKISGTGTNAILAGSWGSSKRVMILGNDLTGFRSYESDPYKIVLEAGTKQYLVVGEPVANVANYGTDNLIAGTRFLTPRKPGLSMPDDMKQLLGAMKNLKGGFHIGKR